METPEPELILHHYAISPYSEKVRLALGLKNLGWRSLEVAPFPPRPHTMPLTSGFRRIPILQIGADLYCDTQIIARELERRMPSPSLFPDGNQGAAFMLGAWTDSRFFMAMVPVVIGSIQGLPEAFVKDRESMTGGGFDFAQLKAAIPVMRPQIRAQLAWIDEQLADGRSFLLGEAPGWADISAYFNLWFLRVNAPGEAGIAAPFRQLAAWEERVKALGHGQPTDIDGEQALEIARSSEPSPPGTADEHCPNGFRPGDAVCVTTDDYGKDPVVGTLLSSSAQHVSLRTETEAAGAMAMHFPRVGYIVSPA